MNTKKKLLSILATISFLGVAAFLPTTVHGATAEDLQAQINALLAQIQALQYQSSIGSGAVVSSGCVFSGDFTIGSRGDGVMCLQKYLNGTGYLIASSGAGSPGSETSTFGSLTKAALAKWQVANKVFPASGYFGAISRAKYNSLVKETAVVSIPVAPPAPVAVPEAPAPVLAPETPAVIAPSPALPNPFESTLKIEMVLAPTTLSGRGEKTLATFRLSSDEKIGITRIRFINSGTLFDSYITNIKLLSDSDSGTVLATINAPIDKAIEFNLTPDPDKSDKGILVSGGTYFIRAYLISASYGESIPYIKLDLQSQSDISAFDYNDLTRVADISKSNTFPIPGPKITAP